MKIQTRVSQTFTVNLSFKVPQSAWKEYNDIVEEYRTAAIVYADTPDQTTSVYLQESQADLFDFLCKTSIQE